MRGFRWLPLVLALAAAATSSWSAENPVPLEVREIASGVFVYEAPYALASPRNSGAIANAGFIVGDRCVAVIDTEGSYAAGRALLAAIVAKTALPVCYVVNTHFHPDHVLGNAAFARAGTTFVAHENLGEALQGRADRYLAAAKALVGTEAFVGTEVVLPTLGVHEHLELDLGNRVIVLECWPTAHTNSDLTVFDRRTATWFLGDLLFFGHVPALDGNLKGWIRVARELVSRRAAQVVPGHGPASLSWPDAARPMIRYLDGLEADVRRMVAEGRTMREAASRAGQAEAQHWALFTEFNARNATSAFHELEWE